MKSEENGFVIAIFFAIAVAIWVASAAMEASTYNRVTGSNVSTWDAMFLDLRVQAEPKK